MAAPHNIFADTELGGKLTFRQLPVDGSGLLTVLGLASPVSGLSDVFKFSSASLQGFLGISGLANEFAFFGANNSLSSGLMKKNGNSVDFFADLNLTANRSIYAATLLDVGTDPTLLRIACFDGASRQLRSIGPPTIASGKVYYLQMSATGFGWNEQTPGGGAGTPGVTGSGNPGYAAKWNSSTDLTSSSLLFNTSGAAIVGNFGIWPGGEPAFVVEKLDAATRQWFSNILYTPDFISAIKSVSRVLVNEDNYIRGSDSAHLLDWLSVYTRTQVDSLVSQRLPLTAGLGTALTGDLLIDKAFASLILRSGTGQVFSTQNVNGVWVLLQSDRTFGNLQNGLEYSSSTGDFKVWQNPGAGFVQRTVATQEWANTVFDVFGHTILPNRIILSGTNVLVGGGPGGASEISPQSPLTISGGQLQTSAKVASVWLTAPSHFSVTSGTLASPVTTTGSLTFAWVSVTANTFLAGPANAGDKPADPPVFRTIVAADIPNIALGTAGDPNSGTALFGDRQWRAAVPDVTVDGWNARTISGWFDLSPVFASINTALGEKITGSGTVDDLAQFATSKSLRSISKSGTKSWLAITSIEVAHGVSTVGTVLDTKAGRAQPTQTAGALAGWYTGGLDLTSMDPPGAGYYARAIGGWTRVDTLISTINSQLDGKADRNGGGTADVVAKWIDARLIGPSVITATATHVTIDAAADFTAGNIFGTTNVVAARLVVGGVLIPVPPNNENTPTLYAWETHPNSSGGADTNIWKSFTPGIQHDTNNNGQFYASRNGSWQSFVPGGGGISEPPGVGTWVRVVTSVGPPVVAVWKELVGSAATGVTTT